MQPERNYTSLGVAAATGRDESGGANQGTYPMVLVQPTVKSPVAGALNGMEQAESGDLAGPKIGLGMFGNLPHVVVHFTEQLCDKILKSHPIPPGLIPHQYLAGTG